jgi:Pirin C-terminal cupin domain
VMNTRAELEQAFEDFQKGRMGHHSGGDDSRVILRSTNRTN